MGKRMITKKTALCHIRNTAKSLSVTTTIARAAAILDVNRTFIRYWKQKALDPNFHALLM